LAASLCIAASSHAAIRCETTWEVSPDNGATWTSSYIEVPQSQASVKVRLKIDFDGAAANGQEPEYLNTTYADPIVRAVSGGNSDTSSDWRAHQGIGVTYGLRSVGLVNHRQGTVLKLDRTTDTSPPGVGTSWGLFVSQELGPLGTVPIYGPLPVFDYTLRLDGSLGRRDISGAWRPVPAGQPQAGLPWIAVGLPGIAQFALADEVVLGTTSLVVVPSPAGAGVIALAGLVVRGRRRR
jgi:hypothetical protein